MGVHVMGRGLQGHISGGLVHRPFESEKLYLFIECEKYIILQGGPKKLDHF